jgi:hypothetical protein
MFMEEALVSREENWAAVAAANCEEFWVFWGCFAESSFDVEGCRVELWVSEAVDGA